MRRPGRPSPASGSTALAPHSANALKAFLESPAARNKIAEVASRHLSPDRLLRVTLTAVHRNPRILDCSRESVLLAMMEAAAAGIEPGLQDQRAALVPRKNKRTGQLECQFVLMYRGMIELMRRSGEVSSVEARVVYSLDAFDLEYGLAPKLVHKPKMNGQRGEPTMAYAIVRLKDSGAAPIVDTMSVEEIEQIRARSPAAHDGPWKTDWSEMARKTVLRRVSKYAPMGLSEAAAIQRDAERELGANTFASDVISDDGNGHRPGDDDQPPPALEGDHDHSSEDSDPIHA
jgi:recombination protein RecT